MAKKKKFSSPEESIKIGRSRERPRSTYFLDDKDKASKRSNRKIEDKKEVDEGGRSRIEDES